MRFLIATGLFVGAHFGLCYVIPQSGPVWSLFPSGSDQLHGGTDVTVLGEVL